MNRAGMLLFAAMASSMVLMLACPPTPAPVPPTPDADAAPAPTVPEASPPAPVSADCTAACATMTALHCSGVNAKCPHVMAQLEADRLIRAPDGSPVTCACVAKATSAAGVQGCGVACWTGDAAP